MQPVNEVGSSNRSRSRSTDSDDGIRATRPRNDRYDDGEQFDSTLLHDRVNMKAPASESTTDRPSAGSVALSAPPSVVTSGSRLPRASGMGPMQVDARLSKGPTHLKPMDVLC
ncbi:uncharacterized protein B0H18DRAFT_667056 [Fomitopsis serialis]|uniref:uncharacterized protein n=1 Tax=Fomitopsis serialis TaxID=139415 RepID=UPI0020081A1F|nr:uncharacterized protein B0H18DRAFT_667056 [Neoantrodia serialis]KAH9918490.1 hypothetical protein B0H18DRAFT_667056 [Neoantrodia serialis]